MKQKFLKCNACGKIMHVVKDSHIVPKCCGKDMIEIIPGTVDASVEKHLPVFEDNGGKIIVSVGSVEHPMTEEHYIQFIEVFCDDKILRKYLEPNQKPEFLIKLNGDVKYAREYCNIHGLWKGENHVN